MTNSAQLDAVLFDLDGTLIDTAPDFASVVNQLCRQHGRPEIDYPQIRHTVSHGARALVTLAFDCREGDQQFDTLRLQLLELYSQQLAVKTALFDGIAELLSWLESQSLPWGIVTNKPRLYAEPLLAALALAERCGTLVCPDDVRQTKPHAEPMLLACKQIACKPGNTVYIGDHRRDIEAGSNAGMQTIAANYGYIDPSDPASSWQASYTVEQPADIQALLAKHFLY
jgi:phosphoglycolate phosphatase